MSGVLTEIGYVVFLLAVPTVATLLIMPPALAIGKALLSKQPLSGYVVRYIDYWFEKAQEWSQ